MRRAIACRCAECRALDRAHPHDGRQLCLLADDGPASPQVRHPYSDAIAIPAAIVSNPRRPMSELGSRHQGPGTGDPQP